MKYAVIYKGSYYAAGYDDSDPGYTAYYDTIKEFENKESLVRWIDNEESKYSKPTYRVIQFEELTVNKTIQIDLIKD